MGAQAVHKTKATVKKVDAKAGSVTLAHEPVASLNWPAMTMGFKVKDSALLSKLTEGKRVDVEFVQEGKDYVIQSSSDWCRGWEGVATSSRVRPMLQPIAGPGPRGLYTGLGASPRH